MDQDAGTNETHFFYEYLGQDCSALAKGGAEGAFFRAQRDASIADLEAAGLVIKDVAASNWCMVATPHTVGQRAVLIDIGRSSVSRGALRATAARRRALCA